MPGYILPREHGPAVRDGRQRITLAAPRENANPGGHAAVGDPVQIDLAKRGDKPRERIAVRRCILRAQLVITETALVRVLPVRFREHDEWSAEAERIAAIVTAAEQGAATADADALLAVARLAGFRSWKALFAFNSHRDRRARPDEQGRVTRDLIGWSLN